jgi:DNA repair protein RecN (Recombination protein N)
VPLERLTVANLALVERAELALGPGLNVVTGETGAGKSLLIQSMSLVVGERADAAVVREGAASAIVEAEFHLEGATARRAAELLAEWGIDFDGQTLIVRREVQAEGKSRATVNQAAVTLASLKRLGEILADLHGQHEHQSLLRADAGVDTLDRLAGLERDRGAYADALAAWREATGALDRLEKTLSEHAEKRAWMEEAAREIDAARLAPGDEEDLRREAARLAHADRLRELTTQALDRLSEGEGSALEALREAAHAVEQAAQLDATLADALPTLEESRIAANESARALAEYAAALEADPRALEAIEARRETIARLTRKYRREVPDLLGWREEIGRELALGEDAEGARRRAREAADGAGRACLETGRLLSRRRREAAREWSARLTRELKPLGMSHAHLEIAVEPGGDERAPFPGTGLDRVELRFTANAGETPRPLARIASGGELSRVMLALKTALEAQDRVDLLIFDEVDSGIGGAVAQAVGERLRTLARHRQIVCVTHLPMIAALAAHHFRVTKHVTAKRTVARIEPLDEETRVDELARMLAGDLATQTTRRQAKELLSASVSDPGDAMRAAHRAGHDATRGASGRDSSAGRSAR